jgi:hypothetical protein
MSAIAPIATKLRTSLHFATSGLRQYSMGQGFQREADLLNVSITGTFFPPRSSPVIRAAARADGSRTPVVLLLRRDIP